MNPADRTNKKMKHNITTATAVLARQTLSFRKPLIFALSMFGVLSPPGTLQAAAPSTTPTILTVTSGKDPDDSLSNDFSHPDGLHTLRRAIVQARNTPGPVEIKFNIPQLAEDGYDSTLGIWRLMIYNTTRTQIFRQLTGNITLDGSTQPGGRPAGPKIMIVGPGTGMKEGLIAGETATQNSNIIRDLGFQNLRTSIYVNSDNNIIQRCWFGLNNDGTRPLLRQDNPQNGSGADGISLASGADQNQIQYNYFLGLSGVAAAVRGTGNTFGSNFIGTRSDGQVTEKQTDPDLIGSPVDWLGGSGISVSDDDNIIENNFIAGIRIQVSQWSLQADAMRVSGKGHIIRNNRIGYDCKWKTIGVCGRGIYLSDSPKNLQLTQNTIANSELSAISMNGILYDANTLRGNVIRKSGAWRQVDGMPAAEDAIQVGPSLPAAFRNFKPAKVTSIHGTAVSGTSGDGSPCPNAVVELFLANPQSSDAQQSLGVVTADSQGNWIATIPFVLNGMQGIRTTTTTSQWGDIPNMGAGTTTGLSTVYTLTNINPEIVVEQPAGTYLPDNGSRAFGSVPMGSNAILTFTIKNTGGVNLTGLNITKNGTNASDFTVTAQPAATVPAGASTTFAVRFKPSAKGTRKAAIHIASNDANENPFDINLTGTGTAPEIVVQQPPGTNVADGGGKNFGNVTIGKSPSRVFTIKNTGTASLKNLAITKNGANAANFTVTAPAKTTLSPGGSTTFKVTFKPTAKGKRVAAIHIANNDANENPFDINLTGTGLAASQSPQAIFGTDFATLQKQDQITLETTTVTDMPDGLKYLALTVPKAPGTEHQPRTVEVSPNLVDWYSGNNHTTIVTDDASLLKVRDNTPIVPGTKRYIRLKTTRQ